MNLFLSFRVSSLAYPNLLGKKGYAVVVVVFGTVNAWMDMHILRTTEAERTALTLVATGNVQL